MKRVKSKSLLKRRPEWDEMHLLNALNNAARSTCVRRNMGAVLVAPSGVDIIQGGYNGTPESVKNCNEGGCPRCNGDFPPGEGYELCLCEHAERNAYARAARRGVPTLGSTLYVNREPCGTCLKMAMSMGSVRVVFIEDLKNDDPLRDLIVGLKKIKLEKYNGPMEAINGEKRLIKQIFGRDV